MSPEDISLVLFLQPPSSGLATIHHRGPGPYGNKSVISSY